MKNVYYLMAACTILFSCNGSRKNQSISVSITNSGYKFEASYPEGRTEKVVEYIEKSLGDDKLYTAPSDVKDAEVNLGDSIKFYLKSSPGEIEIDFKKQNNSETSYNKLVEMCKGIKEVLK